MADWQDYLAQIQNAAAGAAKAADTSPTTGYPIQNAVNPNMQGQQLGQGIQNIIKGVQQQRASAAMPSQGGAGQNSSNDAYYSTLPTQPEIAAPPPVGEAPAGMSNSPGPSMVNTTANPSAPIADIPGLQQLSAKGGRIKYAGGGLLDNQPNQQGGNNFVANGSPMPQQPMTPSMAVPPPSPMATARPAPQQPLARGGVVDCEQNFARGGGMAIKGMHPVKIQKTNVIRLVNPIKGFSEGGSMDEMRDGEDLDPGTAEFETLAHGGEVDGMHEAAKHLRSIHHMLPKSAQPHNAKAHKAVLDELHNSFMGDGGSDMPGTSDPMQAAGPNTPPAGPPPQMDSKGGMIEAEPGEKKADKKEESKKKKDHEKHSAGGAIMGKSGQEKMAHMKAENYARGGYVDPGTSEFGMSGSGTARGGGLAKRGCNYTYSKGGCVK